MLGNECEGPEPSLSPGPRAKPKPRPEASLVITPRQKAPEFLFLGCRSAHGLVQRRRFVAWTTRWLRGETVLVDVQRGWGGGGYFRSYVLSCVLWWHASRL